MESLRLFIGNVFNLELHKGVGEDEVYFDAQFHSGALEQTESHWIC